MARPAKERGRRGYALYCRGGGSGSAALMKLVITNKATMPSLAEGGGGCPLCRFLRLQQGASTVVAEKLSSISKNSLYYGLIVAPRNFFPTSSTIATSSTNAVIIFAIIWYPSHDDYENTSVCLLLPWTAALWGSKHTGSLCHSNISVPRVFAQMFRWLVCGYSSCHTALAQIRNI